MDPANMLPRLSQDALLLLRKLRHRKPDSELTDSPALRELIDTKCIRIISLKPTPVSDPSDLALEEITPLGQAVLASRTE